MLVLEIDFINQADRPGMAVIPITFMDAVDEMLRLSM